MPDEARQPARLTPCKGANSHKADALGDEGRLSIYMPFCSCGKAFLLLVPLA